MANEFDVDRRTYLATVGAAGVAGVAGCPDDGRNGGNTDTDGNGGTEDTEEDGGNGDDAISLATASDFPPFEYIQDGPLVGFDVALVEEVVDRAGYEVDTWVDIKFEALIQELNADQFDLVAAAMTVGLDREEEVAFSTPYYETDQVVLVHSEREFQPEEESDLEGRLVGAQADSTSEARIMQLVEDGVLEEDDYRQFVRYPRAIDALVEESIDAVVVDRRAGEALADGRDVETAFLVETDEEYALAMRQDDDRIEDVDEALAEVREDGTYDEFVAEFLEDADG